MSLLTQTGVMLGAYLAAGRAGVIAACLFTGIDWQTAFAIVFFIDLFQIPVYGLFMETSGRLFPLPQYLSCWLEKRKERITTMMAERTLLRSVGHLRSISIAAVAFLPLRGCGILSASILAFLLGYKRVNATLLIMCGSVSGTGLLLLLFYLPARWLHGM
jgi:hypothetical protein